MIAIGLTLGSIFALPSAQAETCVPAPTGPLALVCASAETVAWDLAESDCAGAVFGGDCWYVRTFGRHAADGGVVGQLQLSAQGSPIGADLCNDLAGSCTTLANKNHYIDTSLPRGSGCVVGVATSTSVLVAGLTVADQDTASC